MKYDVIVIGAGASGLMAAYSAARSAADAGEALRVCVLEKMPRPARKVMITGKGRCNFTNVKDWNEFAQHIRSGSQFLRPAWRNFPPQAVVDWFESFGMPTVVERGDRAYPASHRSGDVVDALVRACQSVGVVIQTESEVINVEAAGAEEPSDGISPMFLPPEGSSAGAASNCNRFIIHLADGSSHKCSKLIIATGGLSYPATGSTGDGLSWARTLGHTITPLFPSLTALVPKGYKDTTRKGIPDQVGNDARKVAGATVLPKLIHRDTPLTEFGQKLCGIQLKNVGLTLFIQGTPTDEEFGDIDFTDGGIEGPIGFQLSRKAVKALTNGSRVALSLDLKPGVSLTDLTVRVKELWAEIDRDPRSRRLREKERCRVLLGKLMPWELIPGFTAAHPEIITLERRGRADTKVWVNLVSIAKALKDWRFDIDGHVGWERAVITAGGISTDEVVPKTLESRLVPGLYFCGEALDIDADTGGYNLQLAFCTGRLAGQNAVG